MVNLIVMTICSVILIVVFVAWIWSAATGSDIAHFNRLRTTNPGQYKRLRSIGRFNGLLCSIMSLVFIVASPFAAVDPQVGILGAALGFCIACVMFWLSARWFWWALWAPRP